MPLSIIGTPASALATTVTLPTHAVGDYIIFCAFNSTTTAVTKPAAGGTVPTWNDIDAPAGNNGTYMRTAWALASATNHTSGTWTNAVGVLCIVIRGAKAAPIGGHTQAGGSATDQAVAPATTLSVTDGSSIILEFYGQTNASNFLGAWDAAPAGYTRQTQTQTTANRVCLNTKTVTTTDGAVTQTGTTNFAASPNYQGATIEVLALTKLPAPVLIRQAVNRAANY